ncbi:hypothetical protein LARV_03811 [Longilinea arvoryzae]|uniref:Right handed beta helix region n=1 Tax=Longilinea arvoryzae TaxID=360412 RepID=A0A0K8MYA4_9CHLR|nr:choice-of-anchor D domain-containing protein [Longilinea arvoryzae]GAP16016.1 hypothetical protein LARV_03811 [Longilinea arvoryzae]
MKKQPLCTRLKKSFGLVSLIALVFSYTSFASSVVVHAQGNTPDRALTSIVPCGLECNQLLSAPLAYSGHLLVVTNTGEEVNGDTSSPAALIAAPGPDGISLPEAITAAEATGEYDTIRFDPALRGSVIDVHVGLPTIGHGNLTIDGDIDNNGTPDITLEGVNSARDTGFVLYGASHVAIRGFVIQNFDKHGISISPDTAGGAALVEDISLYQNIIISAAMNAINVGSWMQGHTTIRNVEIVENTLRDGGGGIAVHGGMGDGAMDNVVSGISILSNTIQNPGYNIGIFLSPSSSTGLSRNTLSGIEVRGNLITGHANSSILIDSSNQANCNDNLTENIVIADNRIDGPHVTIEVVGASGTNSSNNRISNIALTGNVLSGGGIQFGVATNSNTNTNRISSVLIERNHISSCLANGIYLIAGSGGAQNNRLENVILRSNFINDCSDAGILLHGDTSYSPNNVISNVTITQQTLVNNGNSWAGGLNINTKDSSNTITGVTLTNSILWGNEGGDAIRGALAPDLVSNTILGDGRFTGTNANFYQDPLFVDPAAGDYHLQAISPGVDTGLTSAPSIGVLDLDRNFRIWDGDGDAAAEVDRGAWETHAIAMQEIDVRSNGVSIHAGDVVPAPWDGTDLGNADVAGLPVQQTYTIQNTGDAPMVLTGAPRIEISGENAADFSVVSQPGSQVNGGESVTFTIAFAPGAAGIREATVTIANDDDDENPFTFTIQGNGTASSSTARIYLPLVLRPIP